MQAGSNRWIRERERQDITNNKKEGRTTVYQNTYFESTFWGRAVVAVQDLHVDQIAGIG
jgi:hypothetical protein